jgi:predicted transcriptional regulator
MRAELKSHTLTVEFKDISSIEKELLTLAKNRTPKIQPKNIVYFDSMGSFRNFMTIQKLEILALIAEGKLKSVYELSKMLNRAIAPVQKDCQMLEAAGFIVFNKEKGGRGTITPRLTFPYHCILVKLPEHPYELQFKTAA